MSQAARQWKYLESRPGSSYRQLCIKGKRIWAWTLYCETMQQEEPRSPEQLAEDFGVPLEAVQEAIEYCQSDPPEIHEDKRKDDLRAEATGMNDPDYKYGGKFKLIPPEEMTRILNS